MRLTAARTAAALGGLLLILAPLGLGPVSGPAVLAPATAGASGGACPGDTGVTVVVDFQSLGAGTIVACTDGPVGSGFEALSAAGIAYRTVTSQPGFLCTIEGLPSAETCTDIPPADAYWSYWSAERGGSWQYSQRGAASRVPAEGTVEGWSFSNDPANGTPPRTAPPAATPDPTPTATPTPTGQAAATTEPAPAAPVPPSAAPADRPGSGSGSATAEPVAAAEPAARPTTPAATAPTAAEAETTATARPTPAPNPTATPSPTPGASASPTPASASPTPAGASPTPDASASPTPGGPTPTPTPSQGASDGPSDPPPTSGGLAVDQSQDGPPVTTMVGAGLLVSGAAAALLMARRRQAE